MSLSLAPRILVDARFRKNPLGGDRCRFELARNLDLLGSEKYFFLVYEQTRSQIASKNVVLAKHQPNEHPAADIFEHYLLPKQSKKLGIDIYHGTFNVLPLIAAGKLNVVTVHDMAAFAFPQAYSKRFAPYMRFLISQSVKQADHIITVSDATKHELLKFLPDTSVPIITILNGVGAEFLAATQYTDAELQSVKNKYSIDSPYVLFVGNLELKKNLSRLIEAFQRLKKNHTLPHKLLVAGKPLSKGPQEQFEAESKNSEIIRFLGYVDDSDLPKLYRAAELIAYPSLYEGFGLPVLEGMAAGVPVLTSNVSSLPEVAGDSAWLVDPYDVDAIAQGLYNALTQQDRRQELIGKGLKRAEMLSWSDNVAKTRNLYEEIWNASVKSVRT